MEGFPLWENPMGLQLWTLPGFHGNICTLSNALQSKALWVGKWRKDVLFLLLWAEAIWERVNLELRDERDGYILGISGSLSQASLVPGSLSCPTLCLEWCR